MDYRLLALDIDGTLTNAADELTEDARRAVRAARQSGIQVVLCSGRRIRTLRPIAEALGLDGPAIVQNGASIRRIGDGARLRERFLEADLVATVWDLLSPVAPPLAYIDDPDLPEVDLLYAASVEAHAHQRRYVERWRHVARPIRSGQGLSGHSVVMLSCMADAETLDVLRGRIDHALGTRVRTDVITNASIGGAILEIRSRLAGKWPALAWLAESAGIETAEIVAIGDDHNDAEMLAAAGLGIAMESAPPEVIAAADVTTGSHAAEGVARAIERYVLRGDRPATNPSRRA